MAYTPRTDAACFKAYREDCVPLLNYVVDAMVACQLERELYAALSARLRAEVAFDEWMARELPRATGYEIDLCRTVWLAASKSDSAGVQSG